MKRIALAALGLISAATVQAQTPLLRSLALPPAVRTKQIQAFAQDTNGTLWVGTTGGLLSYNGADALRLFTVADGMATTDITALLATRDGALWIGHRDGSLSRMVSGKLSPYTPEEGTPTQAITDMAQDAQGRVWLTTNGEGIYYQHDGRWHNIGVPAEPTVEDLAAGDGAEEGLADEDNQLVATCVVTSAAGTWVGTDQGLLFITTDEKGSATLDTLSMVDGLPDNLVEDLVWDNAGGRLWIAMRDSGLTTYYPKEKRFETVPGWRQPEVMRLAATPDGNVWVGTQRGTLVVYNSTQQGLRELGVAEGLPRGRLGALFADRQGTLWIGSQGAVVSLLGQRFGFIDRRAGLSSNNITALLKDSRSNYWVGTDSGLTVLRPDAAGHVKATRYLDPRRVGAAAAAVLSICEDPQKAVWVGTNQGIYRVAPGDAREKQILKTDQFNSVYSMSRGPDGSMWLATEGGLGRARLTEDGNATLQMYTTEDGLPSIYVYGVHVDATGRVWVAMDGGGVAVYEQGRFKTYGPEAGLASRTTTQVVSDASGRVFVLTADSGITQFKDGRFLKLNNEMFASGTYPVGMATTTDGQVVAMASGMITRVDPATDRHQEYSEDDGLLDFAPNASAIYTDNQGLIWIGTASGMVMFNPKSVTPSEAPPPVALLKLRILQNDTTLMPEASFAFDENEITFDYIAVDLARPRRVRYQYQLVGYDREWSLPTTSRFATYQSLPYGDYQFQVRASIDLNNWSAPTVFTFTIRPPLIYRWYVFVPIILLVIGTVFLLIRARIAQVERRNRELEQRVKERTAEVVAQKEKIELQNADITESIQYAKRIQTSILPEVSRIRQAMPEAMVVFHSKDIVSGDFYWFHRSENRVLLAAVDCTGHGVPGAFMSLMGYNLLNQIQNTLNEHRPEEVLQQLDKLIFTALRQNAPEGFQPNDGMDVALCTVDLETNRLVYAGALRPLYYIRNEELHEVKGSRFPIGGDKNVVKAFEPVEITIEPGDCFYIFSDGVVDQFGGDSGRKYTPKRLKEFLKKIHHLPMEDQALQSEREMADWMKGYDQLDDQLLIGFRPVPAQA